MRVLEHCKKLAPEAMAWALAAAALCVGIGSYPLSDNNEGLYAAVGAGMLRSGHFLIPRIAGLPYIGKPPLLYWLLAASFAVWGRNALAARLVPATAALGTCLVLYVLLRRLGWRREANIAVLVFGTCAGAIVLAHVVLFDMVLTLGLTIALAGVCVWYVGRAESQLPLRVGAAGLAAAIMTKGLVAAVLLGGTLAVLAWLEPAGGRAWMRRIADPVAAGVLLGLTVPWHLAAAVAQRGFLWFYFLDNQVLRFLGLRRPHDYHEGAWYFYLPLLALSVAPWLLAAPALGARAAPADDRRRRAERFFLVAAVVPVVFFSASRAKADYYTILCLPPLAAWFALRLGRLRRVGWSVLGVCAASWAGVMLGMEAGVAMGMPRLSGRAAAVVGMLRARPQLAWAVAVALIAAPLGTALAVRRRAYLTALGSFGLQSVIVVLALTALAAGAAGQFSDASLARSACRRPGGPPLLLYEQPEAVSAALFYCHSRFQVIDSRSGDLWLAQRLHDGIGRIFLDDAQALRGAGRRGRSLLVPHRDLARFARSPLAARAVPLVRAPTATWFELVGRRRWLLAAARRHRWPLGRQRRIRTVAR